MDFFRIAMGFMTIESKLVLYALIVIILYFVSIILANNVYASSPSFARQSATDLYGDWGFNNEMPGSNITKCVAERNSSFALPPDITEVNYLSDGKVLHATLWMSSPIDEFKSQKEIDSLSDPSNLTHKEDIFSMIVEKNNQSLSLSNHDEEIIEKLHTNLSNVRIINDSPITISGNPGRIIRYTHTEKSLGDLTGILAFVVKNNFVYTLRAQMSHYSYFSPIFHRMLDSFDLQGIMHSPRMTGNFLLDLFDTVGIIRSANGTDNLLTYQSPLSGSTIKYPLGWERVENNTHNKTIVYFYPSYYKIGRTIIMSIDVNSAYDLGLEDYRLIVDWDESTQKWTKEIWDTKSSSSKDKNLVTAEYKILDKNNYTGFYTSGKSYIDLTLDLSKIGSPDQYNLLFFVTDNYVSKAKNTSCAVIDLSNQFQVPPPEFSITASPASVNLMQDEHKNIELKIKNTNVKMNSTVLLSANKPKDIDITLSPNQTSIPSLGTSTVLMNVGSTKYTEPHPYTVSITADFDFPLTTRNLSLPSIPNKPSATIKQFHDLTVTVLQPLTLEEQLHNFLTGWFNPLTGAYSTIVTIITGILGWKIWKHQKKK